MQDSIRAKNYEEEMMNCEVVSIWARNTIPGIIILGTIGSILAIYVLRFLKWLLRKYALTFLALYAAKNVRPFILSSAMTTRFLNRNEKEKLIFYSVWSVVSFSINSVILEVLVIATVYVFFKYGTTLGHLQIAMVSITLISAHCWIKEFFAIAGIVRVLIYDDILEVTKALKSVLKAPSNVFEIAKWLTESNLVKLKPKSTPDTDISTQEKPEGNKPATRIESGPDKSNEAERE